MSNSLNCNDIDLLMGSPENSRWNNHIFSDIRQVQWG